MLYTFGNTCFASSADVNCDSLNQNYFNFFTPLLPPPLSFLVFFMLPACFLSLLVPCGIDKCSVSSFIDRVILSVHL